MRRAAVLACLLLSIGWSTGGEAAGLRWSKTTVSPQQAGTSGNDAALHAVCGAPERGLTEVAHQVVSRRVTGASAFDDRQLQQLARAAGVPQPLPRAWLLSGDHPASEV